MAICLDMDKSLRKKYPGQWKEATFGLSGYWKIMDNIFFGGDFKALDQLKEKFRAAGFKTPRKDFDNKTLWHTPETWKDPEGLYPALGMSN